MVAQLVRALACHARGRGFEPHPSRHTSNNLISADLAHLVERHLAKVEVAGSSPVIRSKEKHLHKAGAFCFKGAIRGVEHRQKPAALVRDLTTSVSHSVARHCSLELLASVGLRFAKTTLSCFCLLTLDPLHTAYAVYGVCVGIPSFRTKAHQLLLTPRTLANSESVACSIRY